MHQRQQIAEMDRKDSLMVKVQTWDGEHFCRLTSLIFFFVGLPPPPPQKM